MSLFLISPAALPHHVFVVRSVLAWVAAAAAIVSCGNTYVVLSGEIPPEGGLGPVIVLDRDIALTGSDSFEAIGSAQGRCVIHGNGYGIRSTEPWSGRLTIRSCDIVGLGTAAAAAIDLIMNGAASAVIDDSTFDASGAVHVLNYDDSTVTFSRNTILATSLVPAVARIADSPPVFSALGGNGSARKFFRGNRILHGGCEFSASQWTIGGDSAADGNRWVGPRAGLLVAGPGCVVRGNYVHTSFPTDPPALPNGQELSPFTLLGDSLDLLVEHNVLRHGFWVVRGISGELRYNAIVDADASDWIIEPRSPSSIHHNVFVNYLVPGEETNNIPVNPTVQGGIELVNSVASGVQIWANTFDGGGKGKFFGGPAISIVAGSFADSIRSNVFMRFAHRSSATIGPGPGEPAGAAAPIRVGYADYNLFFNPESDLADNYSVAVANLVERRDPGFGASDIPAHGAKDAQTDPQLAGPLAERFPWTDDDILAGRVTVTDMLAYFRRVYTPQAGSPVIDVGDPQDGVGADVGAIGAGVSQSNDRFGDLPRETAVGPSPVSGSAGRDSDGPLALRCSMRALGDAGCPTLPWGALSLILLGFAGLLARAKGTHPFAKARAAPMKSHPHGR